MKSIDKVVRIGRGACGSVFCKIQFDGDKLSITGVEGPKSNGDCIGSCGQIIMRPWDIKEYATGWDLALETKFRMVWDRWHLNDMKAGTQAQEEYLRQHPVEFKYPESHYVKACEALAAVGLNPDNGYKYGSKWLKETVPQDVIDLLESLPESNITPAWV